jgi:hypothetical protein
MTSWKGIVGKGFTAEQFDAYAKMYKMDAWRPAFIVVHNTQIPRLDRWHSVPGAQRMQNLATYYRDTKKWSGGPHLFIADDLIWCFTPLNVPGVHSPSWNKTAWGVEIVGDFEHEEFGDDQKSLVTGALAVLHKLAGWSESHLKLHKEDPLTDHTFCPGKNIEKAELEAKVDTLLDLDK